MYAVATLISWPSIESRSASFVSTGELAWGAEMGLKVDGGDVINELGAGDVGDPKSR